MTAPGFSPLLSEWIAQRWGVHVLRAEPGIDPAGFAAYSALFAAARTEQVLRAVSARTNLVLAGARFIVVGGGSLARSLTAALTRIGSLVVVADADPVVRLRAHLAGLDVVDPADLSDQNADFVLLTGERHAAVDAQIFRGVIADVSSAGTGLLADTGGTLVREGVHQIGRGCWIAEIPPPLPETIDEASPLSWRMADALIALSLIVAAAPSERVEALSDDVLAEWAFAEAGRS